MSNSSHRCIFKIFQGWEIETAQKPKKLVNKQFFPKKYILTFFCPIILQLLWRLHQNWWGVKMHLKLKHNLLFVKRRPRELKTRSAVLDVAITQRYFLARLAKWGNLFSFSSRNEGGCQLTKFLALSFTLISHPGYPVLSCYQRLHPLMRSCWGAPQEASSFWKVVQQLESCETRDRASSAIFSQTRSLLVFPQQVTGDTQQSYHNDGCWEKNE